MGFDTRTTTPSHKRRKRAGSRANASSATRSRSASVGACRLTHASLFVTTRCAVHRGSLAQALRLSPAPLRPAPAPAARAASAPTSTRNNAGSAQSRNRPRASKSRCWDPGHGRGGHAMAHQPSISPYGHLSGACIGGLQFPSSGKPDCPQRRRAARAPVQAVHTIHSKTAIEIPDDIEPPPDHRPCALQAFARPPPAQKQERPSWRLPETASAANHKATTAPGHRRSRRTRPAMLSFLSQVSWPS
jgi:hypothetical protein